MAQMPFSPCSDPNDCTDQSVEMLTRIFGPVIKALVTGVDPNLVDASANILATMFGFFNSGILIIGSLIVSYVAVMGVTNTANDGEAMGKSWSSLWTPVRIVAGGAVLLPTTSGFSFIQLIVLMFALWGVGFANGTYKAGMAMGVLSPNGLVEGVNSPGNFYGLRDFARGYLAVSYCAKAANAIYKDNAASGASPEVMTNTGGVDSAGESVASTYDKTSMVDGRKEYIYYLKDRNKITNLAGGSPFCGTVKLAEYQAQDKSDAIETALENVRVNVQDQKRAAAVDMMKQLDIWVGTWPETINDPGWENVKSGQFNTIVNKAELAVASQLVTQVNSGKSGVEGGLDDFLDSLTADGWAAAGGWFQRVGMVRGQISGVLAEPVGSVSAPSMGALPGDARYLLLANSVSTVTEAIDKKAEEKDSYRTSTAARPEDMASLIPKDPSSDISVSTLRADMDAKMSSFVNGVMLNVVEIATGAGSNGKTPLCGTAGQMGGSLNRMKCVGDYLVVARAGILVADVAIKSAGTAVRVLAGTLSSVKGLGNGLDLDKIVTPLWDWVLEVPVKQLALMASYIEPLAFYFSVFLPSLPYTLFMIVFVGWVLAVLQSIIAAPLWAVMHMTPDRTFVGSQTQGYLLLLSLFARPALAILGLFAAVLVSDPVIDYIAQGFFAMRGAVVSSSGNVGAISEFLTFAWWFMVFGLTLLPVLYMIFGLPQTLPDQVLSWIGGGLGSMGETSAVADMRGGMSRVGANAQGSGTGMRLGGGQGRLPPPDGGSPTDPKGGGPRGGGGSGGNSPLLSANGQGAGGAASRESAGSEASAASAATAASDNRTTGEKVSDAAGVALGRAIAGGTASTGRAMRNAGSAALSAGRAGVESFRGSEAGSTAGRLRDGLQAGALTAGAGIASAASAAGADYKQAFSTAGAEGRAAYHEGADARIQAFKESLSGGAAPAGSGGDPESAASSGEGADTAVGDHQFNDAGLAAGSASLASEGGSATAADGAGRAAQDGGAGASAGGSRSAAGEPYASSGAAVGGAASVGGGEQQSAASSSDRANDAGVRDHQFSDAALAAGASSASSEGGRATAADGSGGAAQGGGAGQGRGTSAAGQPYAVSGSASGGAASVGSGGGQQSAASFAERADDAGVRDHQFNDAAPAAGSSSVGNEGGRATTAGGAGRNAQDDAAGQWAGRASSPAGEPYAGSRSNVGNEDD
ncbi:conjugal transfer/type IV secretion protein DotA/TraY [Pseudomonas hunanensis]|uniref:Conjugal transfer/type IV secretion protein DotA/TraY n=1 Tax=Pseudomonas hunanensis TaxID=1247546 RepID=A0ACC6K117_9PSED|nr:DotA/TraY family protein [Pseudomonas hunanensis]MDR6712128.1 conjugal transfer/type IV secretion protein DotA/TraY [Pseudomonas hunanensis]